MITDLRLQNFRSYKDVSFEFNPGVNIIVGPNASGKTNLLEAVLMLARGSSYRAGDPELIHFDKPWTRIDSHSDDNSSRTIKIDLTTGKAIKTLVINDKEYKRLSLHNSLPVVLFEPNHLLLFNGGPERRRDYIDDLLEQLQPGYSSLRRQYRRVLAQRNNLLKQPIKHQALMTQIFPWNVRLSQLAGQIVRARHELTFTINKELDGLYKELSKSNTKTSIAYDSSWSADSYENHFFKRLETGLSDDQLRGFTSHGPHREDAVTLIGGKSAQVSASRGEVRTLVLAIKIIELKLLEVSREITPLLLLDDVFSELDGQRRHSLTDYLAPYQTFITTTDADLVVQHFTNACNVIPLS